MARDQKCRKICCIPKNKVFVPEHKQVGTVVLTLDEIEAVRLSDLEGLDQDTCAKRMEISRATYQRILRSARKAVADAFRYDRLVLAGITYNGDLFPCMRSFIEGLTERNYQNRKVAIIENGTWAPMAGKLILGMFEKSKNLTFTETKVSIKSAMNAQNKEEIGKLAEELC